ncbi:glycosyltransferase family 1 protein [Salinibacterium sp. NSLL150]|nr:glycosyltransferase family 1 protein [Salinibacterium sp. NSLL35]MBH0101276.1 glycosyltransferase family 1 protein [Salinibacterium sp. NSLL150]MBH0104035.1 glycosyltransferase family 1 protein [Salinibacterium sp. NSLL16]MBH0106796.1 glycosyltransferase family 1 protein [Salinibacterium sp. NSLL17]MBH0109432.1 glycosyltransferase family 1 protein [Salinibacterium sp. NG22]
MSSRPSLLIISFSTLISDPRVTKQIEIFKDRYDLYTCGMGPAPEGVVEHFEIPFGIRAWVNDRFAMIARSYKRAYWNLPAVRLVSEILPVGKFDAVFANDIEAVPVALSLGAKKGVHADLHEYFPELKTNNWQWRIFVAPYMMWLCKTYVPQTTSRTAASSGFARRYQEDLGIDFGTVTNAAPFADLQPTPVGDVIRIICTTAGARARRIELIVEAMRDAPPHIELDLIVMPNEPDYVASLKKLGADIPQLKFREPVAYTELVNTVAEYDVALSFIPPTNASKALALPNKFFEAIQARVGVIIGPGPEMTPLIERYGVGESTDDYSVESLRKTLHGLDKQRVEAWKQAAHRAAPELSSEEQVKIWFDAVHDILG